MKTHKVKTQQRNRTHKLISDIGLLYILLLVLVLIAPAGLVQADTNPYITNAATKPEVPGQFPNLSVVGSGELTWFGLSIYSASLWTTSGKFSNLNDSLPMALTIIYNKNFTSHALADRTVKEWKHLGLFDSQRRNFWEQQLRTIWPNVKPGDNITTLVTADRKTRFYHNDKLLTELEDPEFGPALLSIWLDDETSEPGLREKLTGNTESSNDQKYFLKNLLLLAVTSLAACGVTPQEYKHEKPIMDMKTYFDGPIQAWGIFQDYRDKVVKRFHVSMIGSWEGNNGTLDEHFTYSDGTTQRRIWTLLRIDQNNYTGTADDVVGQAKGVAYGHALRWQYTMAIEVDNDVYNVQFDDWMYLIDESTVINRSVMSKFGINVGKSLWYLSSQGRTNLLVRTTTLSTCRKSIALITYLQRSYKEQDVKHNSMSVQPLHNFLTTATGKLLLWVDSHSQINTNFENGIKKVDWIRVIPFVFMHVMCLGVIWVGWSPTAVLVAFGLYLLRMLAITGFYHRYFSHKSFKTSRITQFIFAVLGASAAQRGPIWWASHHRHHHIHSDQYEDAHSPRQHGFLWSHMGWFTENSNFPPKLQRVPDLVKFRELIWLDRFDAVIPIILAVGLYGLGEWLAYVAPSLNTSGSQLLIWGFFISTVVLYHATYTVNSLAHKFGNRRYNTRDDSRNSFLIALITCGEGWHNNHHHFPGSASQGFFWWEIDMTYYFLQIPRMDRIDMGPEIRPRLFKNNIPGKNREIKMNTIIDDFKSVYSKLDADSVGLLRTIYDDNITFVDPFHEIRGLSNLTEYFSKLYKNLESCKFEFTEVYSKPSSALITWNMAFKHQSLSRDVIEVPGSTQIRFDQKIYFHRDYFDAGKMLYENIPVIRTVIKFIKGKI